MSGIAPKNRATLAVAAFAALIGVSASASVQEPDASTSQPSEAVGTGSTCEATDRPNGVGFYYEASRNRNCTWSRGFTRDTPAAPYAVMHTPLPPQSRRPTNSDGRRPPTRNHRRYEVAVAGVSQRLAIVIHDGRQDPEAADALANRIGLAWAQMPPFIQYLVPAGTTLSTRDTGGYFPRYSLCEWHNSCERAHEAVHTIQMPSQYYVGYRGVPAGELTPEFEEMLLHEIGHLLDYGGGWLDRKRWSRAVEKDKGAYVTNYATTNMLEDFAESFVGWVIYRANPKGLTADATDHINKAMKSRITYLDGELRKRMMLHSIR